MRGVAGRADRGPAGYCPRLIYRTTARRGDSARVHRDGLRAVLDAAHQQLGDLLVLVWDGLNTHTSRAMRELMNRDWLTVFSAGYARS